MKLHQYQPINKNTLQNLILQKTWASNPKTFNDPFEFVLRENYSVNEKGKVEYLNPDDQSLLNKIKKDVAKFGVSSFSECEDCIPMWSHYSSSHTGMCLSFIIKESGPGNLHKVNYKWKFPKMLKNFKKDSFKYLITKGKTWEHEKEQRQIFKDGVGHHEYTGILSEITFGCRSTKTDIESVIKICDCVFDNNIEFSKVSIEPNSFRLTKVPINRNHGDKIPERWIKNK